MLEKLHKTQSPRRFQHTLYCTRTHTHTRIQHRRNKQQHTRTGLSVGLVHAHTRRNRSRNTRRNRERREQGCTRTHTQKQKQKHTQKQREKRARLPTVRSSSIQFDPVRSSSIRPRRACETLGGLPDRGREELVEERDVARCCAPAYTNLTNLSLAT